MTRGNLIEAACTSKVVTRKGSELRARWVAGSLYLRVAVAVSVVIASSQCRRVAIAVSQLLSLSQSLSLSLSQSLSLSLSQLLSLSQSLSLLLSQSLSQSQCRSCRNAEDSGHYSLNRQLRNAVGNLFSSERDVKRTAKS